MSSQQRPLFESSLAALGFINAPKGAGQPRSAWRLCPARRLRDGSATAMPIQFAPEPGPSQDVVELGEDQTTGPLPLGFEFEFFGVRYTWFDLSTGGFLTFGTHSPPCRPCSDPRSGFIPLNYDLNNFIALGWTDGYSLGRRQVAYETRGLPHRRRLVLSFSGIPEAGLAPMAAQLVLHERTGMIDVHTTRQDPIANRVSQEAVRFTTAPW
jgi:hypothetical protein